MLIDTVWIPNVNLFTDTVWIPNAYRYGMDTEC